MDRIRTPRALSSTDPTVDPVSAPAARPTTTDATLDLTTSQPADVRWNRAASPERFDFDLMFTVDLGERLLTYANPTGLRALALVTTPTPLDAILDPTDIEMLNELQPRLDAGETWSGPLRLRATALGQRKLEAVVVADRQALGDRPKLFIVAAELTRPDQLLAELAHRATHDYLTGLPNRALLLDRLSLALARHRRRTGPLALMFIDLDDFKRINDTQGHSVGDRVLVEAAATMPLALRPEDTIARMGGDEFVILCGDINEPNDAETIAERVRTRLGRHLNPATGRPVTASIGVAVSLTPNLDAQAMLTEADRAMYEAKAQGRGQIAVRLLAEDEVEITPAPGPEVVRQALYEGTLVILATPVIDLRSGVVTQVEVTPGWQGYSGNGHRAVEFVDPEAEPVLARQLDVWSLQAAVNGAEFFAATCLSRAPRVVTKLSTATPLTEEINALLADLVGRSQDPAAVRLGLIVDEASLAASIGTADDTIKALHQRDVTVSLGAFDGGSLPWAWLAQAMVRAAMIPLPRWMIDEPGDADHLDHDAQRAQARAALGAAVATGRSLGMATIATGVANREQLVLAGELGCDGGAGSLFGRDADPASLVALIDGRFPIAFW